MDTLYEVYQDENLLRCFMLITSWPHFVHTAFMAFLAYTYFEISIESNLRLFGYTYTSFIKVSITLWKRLVDILRYVFSVIFRSLTTVYTSKHLGIWDTNQKIGSLVSGETMHCLQWRVGYFNIVYLNVC